MRMLKTAAAALALAAFAPSLAPAFAQDKETPPPGSAPRDFALPEIETYTLKNGVKVTLVPWGRSPKAVVRAVVRVGNLNDGDKPFIADLAADMMQEGSDGKTAAAIAEEASALGGDLEVGVGLDQTFAQMDVLAASAPEAIALLAGALQRPTFPEAEFGKVRQNVLRNVSIAASQPGQISSNAFYGALYPDHPYGVVIPDAEKLGAITLDEVKAFHAANFGGARTHIFVVGQFDARKVKRAINAEFGKWAKGPAPLSLPVEGGDAAVVRLIDRPGAVQSTIRLGKRVPPIDGSVELEAADTLLGGYFSSRITRNIREDKGYTYSPTSFVNANYKAANWQQNADITSEATGPAIAEIIKEIRRLQTEAPSAEETQGIKNYMNGLFVIGLASRGGMAGQLAFLDLHELGVDYLESYVGKVAALTPGALQAAAATHLPVDELSLVVVGDLKTVRKQLEALPDFKDRLPPQ